MLDYILNMLAQPWGISGAKTIMLNQDLRTHYRELFHAVSRNVKNTVSRSAYPPEQHCVLTLRETV